MRIFFVLLAVCLAACAVPAEKASARNFDLGINFLWGNGDPDGLENRFALMQELGVKQARTDWEWRAVEKKQGVYDWSAMDALMELANRYDIELLPIVHYAPQWALPKKKKPSGVYEMAPRPDAFGAYADFLAASIERYGPNGNAPVDFTPIEYWQVWNEPNIKEFWGPQPNASDFLSLMQAVDKGLGSERNKVKLVHAGLSKADYVFLWQLWEQDPGYGKLFDIMAVHPYFFDPKGGVRAVDAMDDPAPEYAALGFLGSSGDGGFLGKVFNLQLFMTLKGAPKPIWITEIGFMAGDGNPYAIPESEEADLAEQTMDFIDERLTKTPFGEGSRGDLSADVERVYWFALEDYDFPQDMGNFGLYRSNGTPRNGLIDAVVTP